MPPLQHNDFDNDNSDSNHSTFVPLTDEVLQKKERERKISFGSVGVRTFNRIVGDHPDCKIGPPVSISWEYVEHDYVPLDEYEANHKRRSNLRLTSITRKNLLRNVFEIPENEIRMAEKEVQRIIKRRDQTKKQGKTSEKAEMLTQSARRKLRRVFSKERIWKGVMESSTQFFPTVMA